jgi:ubiquinol-cytochrome c reductase cytochrome c subunit
VSEKKPTRAGSDSIDSVDDVAFDAVALDAADSAELDDTALGFESSVAQTGTETDDLLPRRVKPVRRKGGWRRRVVSGFVLLFALTAMGGIYSAFASASTSTQTAASGDPDAGRQLFSVSCITCHGANLDGVKDRGPSLLGVGGAATYFQVSTGRMPLAAQGAEAVRKDPHFTSEQIADLVAYVQSVGGGPSVPTDPNLRDMQNLAEGGELFRLNCAACHNFAGRGNSLSAGKKVPSLQDSTDEQLYTAMLSGPENMPVFSDNQLTPDQKKQIIAYIQTLKAQADPGGAGLARVGPITEGLVIWVVGIGAILIVIMWIGAKS